MFCTNLLAKLTTRAASVSSIIFSAINIMRSNTYYTIFFRRVVCTGFEHMKLSPTIHNSESTVKSIFFYPGNRIFYFPIYFQSRTQNLIVSGHDCLRGRPRNDDFSVHGEPIFFILRLYGPWITFTASTAFFRLSLSMLSTIIIPRVYLLRSSLTLSAQSCLVQLQGLWPHELFFPSFL